ncbi:MAG: hypothetical protein M1822_009006 [Bathelium mastoideum]|nr:MAG: hypothetical protein M1822_009006 [Bathelium mastoideum]
MSASDVATDVLVLLLPIPKIWTLELRLKQKVALSGVFALGLMAVAASILKLAAVLSSLGQKAAEDPKSDEDLVITEVVWWIMLEVGLAMIACCLPTLRFLFRGVSPESVLHTLRSFLSLHSTGSDKSRSRMPDDLRPVNGEKSSGSSTLPIFGPTSQFSEVRVDVHAGLHYLKDCTEQPPADRAAV